MEKKIISAAIAVVAAVIIYFGGWEIIKFIGSNVFEFPWNSAAILLLSLCTIVLMFLYGVSSLRRIKPDGFQMAVSCALF